MQQKDQEENKNDTGEMDVDESSEKQSDPS